MRQETRRKLTKIVSILSKEDKLKTYKLFFKNNRWRLLVSHVILTLDNRISPRYLANLEASLIEQVETELFKGVFTKIRWQDSALEDVNWSAFESFLCYSYWFDSYKRGRDSKLYNKDSVIVANSMKRDYYNDWLISLSENLTNFNQIVLFILSLLDY